MFDGPLDCLRVAVYLMRDQQKIEHLRNSVFFLLRGRRHDLARSDLALSSFQQLGCNRPARRSPMTRAVLFGRVRESSLSTKFRVGHAGKSDRDRTRVSCACDYHDLPPPFPVFVSQSSIASRTSAAIER